MDTDNRHRCEPDHVWQGGYDSGCIYYHLVVVGTTMKIILDDDVLKKDPSGDILITDSTWHHIVGIRDGLVLRVYIDGEEDLGLTNHGDATLEEGYSVILTIYNGYIGCITSKNLSNTKYYLFYVLIDEVVLWERALSVIEVM